MLGMVSVYNPSDHTILKGDLSDWVSRLVEFDPRRKGKLFVCVYNKIGSVCICEWLARPFEVFVDILNLGKKSPAAVNMTKEKAHELRRRLFAPVTASKTSKFVSDSESTFHHTMQDWNEEEGERLDKVARGE